MVQIENDMTAVPVGSWPALSWGAVLAGFVLVASLSWFFFLLGTAIGASVADLSDAEAIGEGFGVGATLWMVVSALASYFAGSLLCARLSGNPDPQVGMLHGVTLWGFTTLVTLVLGYWGVTGLIETGQSMLRQGAAAASSAVSTAATATAGVASTAWQLGDSPAVDQVQAEIVREVNRVVAEASAAQGARVAPAELREAADEIRPSTLREAALAIARGDEAAAKEVFTRDTALTRAQIDALLEGVAARVEDPLERLSESELARTIEGELGEAADTALTQLSQTAGPEVSKRELRQTFAALDPETLGAVASHIVAGNPQRAQNVLVARTPLTDDEVSAVVEGVSRATQTELEALRLEVREAAENASSYAQAVLWAVFVSVALALVASLAGGVVGASAVERLHALHVRKEVSV